MTAERLFTGSYRLAQGSGLAVIQTSLGGPKWYEPDGELHLLKPWGLLDVTDMDEFATRYVPRLERYGVEKIERAFRSLIREHGGPLCLTCHEADHRLCHRSTFADWWEFRTGERIRDLSEIEPAERRALRQLRFQTEGCC
jgi:hypothetical protein